MLGIEGDEVARLGTLTPCPLSLRARRGGGVGFRGPGAEVFDGGVGGVGGGLGFVASEVKEAAEVQALGCEAMEAGAKAVVKREAAKVEEAGWRRSKDVDGGAIFGDFEEGSFKATVEDEVVGEATRVDAEAGAVCAMHGDDDGGFGSDEGSA